MRRQVLVLMVVAALLVIALGLSIAYQHDQFARTAELHFITEIGFKDGSLPTSDGSIGPLAQKLHSTLTAIQYGDAPDPHGWTEDLAIAG